MYTKVRVQVQGMKKYTGAKKSSFSRQISAILTQGNTPPPPSLRDQASRFGPALSPKVRYMIEGYSGPRTLV